MPQQSIELRAHRFGPRDARWQALRWHALGDGLLDALILLRNSDSRSGSVVR